MLLQPTRVIQVLILTQYLLTLNTIFTVVFVLHLTRDRQFIHDGIKILSAGVMKLSDYKTAINYFYFSLYINLLLIQSRPVAGGGGGCKVDQKWGFSRRVVEVGEVQKVHFLGSKGPLLGSSAPPPIRSWLRV